MEIDENGVVIEFHVGAGDGGFLLFYVPKRSQKQFRKAFSHMHEVVFSLNAQGSSIIHSGA